MGDRANIVMVDTNARGERAFVFLYSHWGGHELPIRLQNALKDGKARWNDSAYLARIIFCRMIGNEFMRETGFGIAASLTDNEHDFLVVEPDRERVYLLSRKAEWAPLEHAGAARFEDLAGASVLKSWTFVEYIALVPNDTEDGGPFEWWE